MSVFTTLVILVAFAFHVFETQRQRRRGYETALDHVRELCRSGKRVDEAVAQLRDEMKR